MKFSLKKISNLEIVLSIVLAMYLFLDVKTPLIAKNFLANKMGVATIFIVLILLIIYANPLVTILYIFAIYEFVRKTTLEDFNSNEGLPEIDEEKDMEIKEDNLNESDKILEDEDKIMETEPFMNDSLEKELVGKMAPVGKSNKITYKSTSYKPVETNVKGSSMA